MDWVPELLNALAEAFFAVQMVNGFLSFPFFFFMVPFLRLGFTDAALVRSDESDRVPLPQEHFAALGSLAMNTVKRCEELSVHKCVEVQLTSP